MTHDEFREWLTHHSRCFPGVAEWIGGNAGTMEAWRDVISPYSLSVCMRATRDMLAGVTGKPYGYAEHITIAVSRARELAGEEYQRRVAYMGGDRVYTCARCLDTGSVSVISPRAMFERRDGVTPWVIRTCAVACDCESGSPYRTPTSSRRPMATYSPDHMVVATNRASVDGPAVDALMAERERSRRVTMFDEWNSR